VDFMAETAAMLASPEQLVLLPAHTAKCPMAAMATRSQAAIAFEELSQRWRWQYVPITYQNSYAEVKAFCGEHGGAVCTSSNARAVMEWGLSQTGHVLFLPDENLGTNSARALGIDRSQIGVWDPARAGPYPRRSAQVVVWKGFCSVHTRFKLADVRAFRARYPDGKVIVHPECTPDVVEASDASASTSGIIRYVQALPEGSVVAVGTESNLVWRLAQEAPGRTVIPLRESRCATMFRITPQHVAYTLEELAAGRVVGRVQVDPQTTHWANLALAKMLELR
jgi:quinolinate synthase